MWKHLGNKVNKYFFSIKTTSFQEEVFDLVNFLNIYWIFCWSSDFSREACVAALMLGIPHVQKFVEIQAGIGVAKWYRR